MRREAIFLCAAAVLFTACRTTGGPDKRGSSVELLAPADWPPLRDDLDADSLRRAGKNSAAFLRKQGQAFHRLGRLQVGTQRLIDTIEELSRIREQAGSGPALERALKKGFELYRVRGVKKGRGAHYSSYYAPVLEASRKRTEKFRYPIYQRPQDLVVTDLGAFTRKMKGKSLVGRIDGKGRFVPYFSRRDIDVRGELKGRKLEIAWLKSGFDRLNLHIQGSGILRFRDGTEALARYAATNALPYKSVGLTLVGAGAMTRAKINSETLKQYLAEHPEGEGWLISQNPRYTFFELNALPAGAEPFGKIGERLTAGRSIAVDPRSVPLGAVAFIRFPMIQADREGGWLGKHPAERFVHCQDVGGAIKGAGRVDLYVGHGPQAKATAHNIWEQGELYILLKKLPKRDR